MLLWSKYKSVGIFQKFNQKYQEENEILSCLLIF